MPVIGGAGLGQVAVLLSAPLIARLYTPEDLGIAAGIISVLVLAGSGASLRYEAAIPLADTEHESSSLFRLCLGLTVIVSLLVGAAAALLHTEGILGFGQFPIALIILLAVLVCASTAMHELYSYSIGIRGRNFGALGVSSGLQGALRSGYQIAGGLLSASPVQLIVSHFIGYVGAIVSLAGMDRTRPTVQTNMRDCLGAAVKHRRFAALGAPSVLLNRAGLMLPSILFLGMHGPAVAGWFALANRIVTLPGTVIGDALSKSFKAEAARKIRDDDVETLKELVRFQFRSMALLAIPLVILAGYLSPLVFSSVFGQRWATAGQYAQYLSLVLGMRMVVAPIAQILLLLGKQHWQLGWDSTRLVAIVLSIALPLRFGGDAMTAVISYSVVTASLYVVLGWSVMRALRSA
jgi:O-antigen/teichoic acid export membrane protein